MATSILRFSDIFGLKRNQNADLPSAVQLHWSEDAPVPRKVSDRDGARLCALRSLTCSNADFLRTSLVYGKAERCSNMFNAKQGSQYTDRTKIRVRALASGFLHAASPGQAMGFGGHQLHHRPCSWLPDGLGWKATTSVVRLAYSNSRIVHPVALALHAQTGRTCCRASVCSGGPNRWSCTRQREAGVTPRDDRFPVVYDGGALICHM